MKKLIIMFAVLVASVSFAQILTTPRLVFTANGSTVLSVVVNSANPASVVASSNAPYSKFCGMQTPILTKPLLYTPYGGPSLFNTTLQDFSYPQNVSITKLSFKACYAVSGSVYENLVITPVYRNKLTGITYEGPTIATVAAGTHVVLSGTVPYISAATAWTLANTGAPDISSLDAANGNIEIGFQIRPAVWSPYLPFTDAVKVFAVDTNGVFNSTPKTANVAVPLIAADSQAPGWLNGFIRVNQTMPDASSGTGVRVSARCADGTYLPIGDFTWGTTTPRTWQRAFTFSYMNSVCSGPGQALYQGVFFNVKVQQIFNGALYGNSSYSNSITL